jgi:hypothetical protein
MDFFGYILQSAGNKGITPDKKYRPKAKAFALLRQKQLFPERRTLFC